MSASAAHGIRVLPGGGRRRHRGSPRWLVSASVTLGLVAVLGFSLWAFSPPRSALRSLPEEQRQVLLSRTVDELKEFCGEGQADALAEHCRELASFAAQFPECRGDCEALVRHHLTPRPTR